MSFLDGTETFGGGRHTTTETPAVTCPNCQETVFTETVGNVTCGACSNEFYARDHFGETCSAVECSDCGEEISFIREHRWRIGDWEGYFCHRCSEILAIETKSGSEPLEEMLSTGWVLNDQGVDQVGTGFGDSCCAKQTKTQREKLATALLNTEATENDSSFHAYVPENTDAHLCFTQDYCVGYITWNPERDNPELGQLYILPAFRKQGIGSGFVEAWREDVASADTKFNVNEPNANMFRLLRSIGAIKVTNEDLEFPGCDITGNWFDLPDEW